MDDETKKFIETCIETNKNLSKITKKEVVSDDLAFTSEVIIKNMKVDSIGDALLFASAINILNTYVKQSAECKKTLGYSFKKSVNVLLGYISNNPNEMIKAEIQKDKDMILCIIEINTIQFSYHNIDLNEENKKLMAEDLDHPTMKWDGIRKQMCSVTLFNFANTNQYERTNKMLDGSDYYTGLNQLLDYFHSGKLSLADSKKVYYGNSTRHKTTKIDNNKNYPLKNRILSLLYKNNIGTFIEQLENRSFFDYLFKAYEDGYGMPLNRIFKYAFKYAIESMVDIFKDKSVSPDAGIGILFFRTMRIEFPIIALTSITDDNIFNVSLIQLLCYEYVYILNDKLIEYTFDNVVNKECLHPSLIMNANKTLLNNVLSYQNKTNLTSCSYLYNATFSEDSNIVSNFDSNAIKKSPIFYSEEREKIKEYVVNSLRGKNGEEILNYINDVQNYTNNIQNKYSAEVQFVSKIIFEEPITNNKKLYIINAKIGYGNNDISKCITELFNSNQYNDFEIFDNIPADTSAFRHNKNILICDFNSLYDDEYQLLKELEVELVDNGNLFEEFNLLFGVGFNDYGSGIDFISSILRITNNPIIAFNKKLYSINVVNKNDLAEEDGIVLVTIPQDVKYDQVEDLIEMSEENRVAIYKQLIKGYKGIKLNIMNTPLRNLVSNFLDDMYNNIFLADDDKNFDVLDKEDFTDIKNLIQQNSNQYNSYSSKIIKCIGSSAWQKLTEDSKSWVVTALSEYCNINYTDSNMDFSGPVLLISKTFESELSIRLVTDYINYIKKNYPTDYMQKIPETLIDIVNEKKVIKPIEKIALGSMPYIMGVNGRGEINNQNEYDQFVKFGKDELFVDKENISDTIKSLCEIIYYVRVNFRNTSAHKSSIDYTIATDCIEYCITKKKKLGVMLDMFNK